MGLLSLVSRVHTCSGSCPELLFQRSRPRLLTVAAWNGLGPAPESRSRGAHPHLSRSCKTRFFSIHVVVLPFFSCLSAAHSISRPPKRSTSRFRRHCSPAPTRWSSNDGVKPLVRTVLQEVLESEMTEALGAAKGERVEGRAGLGYRSGHYTRSLVMRIGKIELRVPQDRQGRFSTNMLERFNKE